MIPILALAAAFLVVDPYAFEQPPLKDGAVLLVVALALALSPWFGRSGGKDRPSACARTFRESLPFALAALSGLILLAAVSAIVHDAVLPGTRDAARWIVYLALAKLSLDDAWERPTRIPMAVLAFGMIAGLIAIAQSLGFDPIFGSPGNEAVSLFGNTNRTGEVMAPVAVLAFFLCGAPLATLAKVARVTLPIAVAAMILSQSRGAIVGAGVGAGAVLLLGPMFTSEARTGAFRSRALLAGAGVLLAVVSGGPSILGAKKIDDAAVSVASLEYPTNKQRLLLGAGVVDMWRDAPFAGHGAGRFRAAFPPYRRAEEAEIKTLLGAFSEAEDPHNLYLLLLAEGGVLALALFLGFALPTLLSLRFSGLLPEADPRRQLAPGVAAAVLTLLAVGAFRSILTEPPAAVMLFVLSGSLLALRGASDRGSSRVLFFAPHVYLAFVLAVGVSILGSNLALANGQRRMKTALASGSLADAMEIDSALAFGESLQPDNPYLLQVRSGTLDVLARESKDPEMARAARARTLKYYPWHAPTVAWFLAERLADGDLRGAAPWARRLLHRGAPVLDDPASVLTFLKQTLRRDAFGPYLLARVRAKQASLVDITACADRAEAEGDSETALSCLRAFLTVRPFAPEIASRTASLLQTRGEIVQMRAMQHRAHLAYGLEFLQRGQYQDAAASAELARKNQDSEEATALFAIARAAQKDSSPLRAAQERDRQPLADDFRAALLELRGNGDLTEAIDAVTR